MLVKTELYLLDKMKVYTKRITAPREVADLIEAVQHKLCKKDYVKTKYNDFKLE